MTTSMSFAEFYREVLVAVGDGDTASVKVEATRYRHGKFELVWCAYSGRYGWTEDHTTPEGALGELRKMAGLVAGTVDAALDAVGEMPEFE